MAKIVFMGAGSSVFVKNVVGDCMLSPVLKDSEFALYDIDPVRLEDSRRMLTALNHNMGGHAQITAYLGVEKRREALRGASYVQGGLRETAARDARRRPNGAGAVYAAEHRAAA